MDRHDQIFFGQAAALTISSPAKDAPYVFLRCIKKKPDGSWEKPTKGEGKAVRLSLEEMIMILQVLNQKLQNWSSYHSYKEENTQISFAWENGASQKLWINIGDYSKMLAFSQIELLRLLMEHLLKEKIKFATISNGNKKETTSTNYVVGKKTPAYEKTPVNIPTSQPEVRSQGFNASKEKEITKIEGALQGETDKAVLIIFPTGQELWFPKSTIHSNYSPNKGVNQPFQIDNWILKKNGIIA